MPKNPIRCEAKDTSVIYTRKGIKYGDIYIIAPYRVYNNAVTSDDQGAHIELNGDIARTCVG